MAIGQQRFSWIPLLTLLGPIGPTACSGSGGGAPPNSGAPSGDTTPADYAAMPGSSGTTTVPTNTGTTSNSGTSSGSTAGSSTGSGSSGSSVSTGAADASVSDSAPGSSGGSEAGTALGSGTGIAAGFPMPTAANYAMCQKVAVGAGSQMPTSGAINACAGQDTTGVCIECLFGGSTYNTTETPTATGRRRPGISRDRGCGGAAAGSTYISAESERGLLAPVTTTAGQTLEFSFVVNARRWRASRTTRWARRISRAGSLFDGPAATPPQVSAIGYQLATAATKPIMVYLASDSTECDQTGGAFGGSGQMLPEFFLPPIGISNWGNSGASSSSFYGAYWGDIKSRWTAGDYAIIQFGHNDKGVPDATVQANLEKYITDALAANVTPIIVSPPARVQFGNGQRTATSRAFTKWRRRRPPRRTTSGTSRSRT